MNSGIIPKALRSSVVTLDRRAGSFSSSSLRLAPNPIEDCAAIRVFIISSRSGNAPPQMKRMPFVFIIVVGVIAFLLPAPIGTSTSEPSRIFRSPC